MSAPADGWKQVRHINVPRPRNDALERLRALPRQTLADRSSWPTLMDLRNGSGTIDHSFRAWVMLRARQVYGESVHPVHYRGMHGPSHLPQVHAVQWLANYGPPVLPVGKQCVFPSPESPSVSFEPTINAVRDLVPFSDDRYAALIVSETVDVTSVTLFFLAEQKTVDVDLQDGGAQLKSEVWCISGKVAYWHVGEPDVLELSQLLKDARKWWGSLVGKSLPRRGRPQVKVTAEDIQGKYWELKAVFEADGSVRRPSQQEVCEALAAEGKALSDTTLQKLIRQAGMNWPPPKWAK